MCKLKRSNGNSPNNRIDKCMKNLFIWFKPRNSNDEVIYCCCGHGKYPMSIIVRTPGCCIEIFSDMHFPRDKKRFYKRDKQGYYYIPEVIK